MMAPRPGVPMIDWLCPDRGQRVTVVGQDDDVEAAVQVDLLQAVHQLTHDPVHALQRHIQLRGSQTPQVNVSVEPSVKPEGR